MRTAATAEQILVQHLLKAAPVVELPLHKVPFNQVNVTFAGSTPAVQGAGFVGVFPKARHLWTCRELKRLKKVPIRRKFLLD